MLREVILLLSLAGPAGEAPGREPLPSDGRLAPVRAQLEARLDRVAGAGLPTELLLNKIREGLAKNVEPQRIATTVFAMADHLDSAQAFLVQQRRGNVPAGLLRAVTEARMSGIALDHLQPLVSAPDALADRAVQLVLDLKWRGYPVERSAGLVGQIVRHDAANLDHLPGLLETIRREQLLSHADSVDALARGMATSDSLAGAYDRAVDDERRKGGTGRGARKSDETDVNRGNSAGPPGLIKVPPGQAKK